MVEYFRAEIHSPKTPKCRFANPSGFRKQALLPPITLLPHSIKVGHTMKRSLEAPYQVL